MHQINSVMHELRVVINQINRRAEASIPQELKCSMTETQCRVIEFLYRRRGKDVFQKDVEAEFAITRATASKMLSNMEQRGLIQRSGVEGDARLKRLCLTEKSLQKFHLMQGSAQRFEQRVTYGMTEEERQELLRLLRIIERNMETDDPRPSAETERR